MSYISGKQRYEAIYKQNPPKVIYAFTGRVVCAKNGDFGNFSGSAINYGWFIWEKGFVGDPSIRWIET